MRVRFAPSPTGHLHIGSARTALFNWLLAQHENGTFILRIEDTDRERSKPEYLNAILQDLRWLGLEWNEGPEKSGNFGPYFQSERLSLYRKYAHELLGAEKAYRCFCAPEELAEKRIRAEKEKRMSGYDGRCRALSESQRKKLEAEGRKPVIRFRSPERQNLRVHDAVRGMVDFSNETLEDFVILKSDGFPLYNFACVIDDHHMEITDVLRGEEHLSNLPRQLVLYETFGWTPPHFGHLSIILDEQRKKLSKREGAAYLSEFRSAGFLPEALLNFLALLGWAPKENLEILPLAEIIRRFGFDGIGKSPAVFDFKKLEWMNGEYIKALPSEDLTHRLRPYLEKAGYWPEKTAKEKTRLPELVALFQERMKTLHQFVTDAAYFFTEAYPTDEEAASALLTPKTFSLLALLTEPLSKIAFTSDELEKLIREFAEKQGIKAAEIIHPLRLLLTGKRVSPGIFQVMALLGKEKTLDRLARGVQSFKNIA